MAETSTSNATIATTNSIYNTISSSSSNWNDLVYATSTFATPCYNNWITSTGGTSGLQDYCY